MKINTKSLFKKIALILAGVTAVTAVGFGISKLVEYTQQDLKTINPTFEVGNLGTDGKYVNDESTLYTKEAFEAEGLQVKLDFDSQIEYQIFYYDDLDNFIESTDVLSAAYSDPVHDGYARIVIIPTDDEDGKIGLTERVSYPSQMTVKVNKTQDVKYYSVFNRRLLVVDNIYNMCFLRGGFNTGSSGNYEFTSDDACVVTSRNLLKVNKFKSVSFEYSMNDYTSHFFVGEFKEVNGELIFLDRIEEISPSSISLNEETTHIILGFYFVEGSDKVEIPISEELLNSCYQYFNFE